MGYQRLCEKRDYLKENIHKLSDERLLQLEKEFECSYTFETLRIKGIAITYDEICSILTGEDVEGANSESFELTKKEIRNHSKAFHFMKQLLEKDSYLDEDALKDLNAIVVEDISIGGVYRNVNLMIPGRKHVPPSPQKAYYKMKNYLSQLPYLDLETSMAKAMFAYGMIIKIHPFVDGNSRTGRLVMNYVLMKDGFLPMYLPKDRYKDYVKAFEIFAADDDIKPLETIAMQLQEAQLDKYIKEIEDK